MRKYIPNFLTVLNLISGTVGVVLALDGRLTLAACAIFTGALFDLFDGFFARWLQVESPMGKQLDSLADLVTFGCLPAGIMYQLIKQYETCPYRPYAALCIVIFSALRLAQFNVDTRQSNGFIGLPTPAQALCVATLPMLLKSNSFPWISSGLTQPLALPLLALVLALLLVSNLDFMALKFRGAAWQRNKPQYAFLTFAACLVLAFGKTGLFAGIWSYLLGSLACGIYLRLSGKK